MALSRRKGGHIRTKVVPARRQPRDPGESWEILFTENEGGAHFRGDSGPHPYTPRRAADIPAGALESLGEICGVEDLHRVFIIPSAVRSIGFGNQKVISPNSVLALGARAVGLWTEKPQPGVKVTIPLKEIAAIEDVTILLYGRLSFLPFGDRLTIRYNTVARDGLEPALLELRKRLTGPAQGLPPEEKGAQELSFKWNNVLHKALVRLQESNPVVYRFARVPGWSRRAAERGQLLVLNPFELVYVCDPVESMEQYGEDSFVVPRSRMTKVAARENCLEVSSNGARFLLSVAPPLCEAAMRWLAQQGG